VSGRYAQPGCVTRRSAGAAVLVAATGILSWVLLWNGFPLLFGDSGSYLTAALNGTINAYRPSGYPVVLLPATATGLFWLPALLQSAVLAYLLDRLLVLDLGLQPFARLGVVAAVAATTTLPWWTATLMSDVWCGVVALCLYLLAYHWHRIGALEKYFLAALFGVSLTFHLSYVLIASLVVVLVLVLHYAQRLPLPSPRPFSGVAISLIAAAFLFFPVANKLGNRVFSPTVGSEVLVLARFAGDGLLVPTLQTRCAEHAWALCSKTERISELIARDPPSKPRNRWPCPCSAEGWKNWILVWSGDAPLPRPDKIGKSPDGELRQIILASLLDQPAAHLRAVFTGTYDLFRNGALTPFIDGRGKRFLKKIDPVAHKQFVESRAAHGLLWTETWNRYLNPLIVIGGVVGFGALIFISARGLPRENVSPMSRALRSAAFFTLFATTNAFLLYALVGDHTRYQSRASWMVVMQLSLLIAALLAQRRRSRIRSS